LRICIIGSSHIGSLRSGWEAIKDQFPEHHIVFFGSVGTSTRHLRVRGGKLTSNDPETSKSLAYTSGGLQEIDPNQYDALILYGLLLRLPRLKRGISMAVMQETIKNIADAGLTLKIASRLRRITKKPLWASAVPLTRAPNGQHDLGSFYSAADLLTELERVFPVSGVTFLAQPAETICTDLRTAVQFGVGATQLQPDRSGAETLRPEGELKHMNGEYGRLWLAQNLPLVIRGAPE